MAEVKTFPKLCDYSDSDSSDEETISEGSAMTETSGNCDMKLGTAVLEVDEQVDCKPLVDESISKSATVPDSISFQTLVQNNDEVQLAAATPVFGAGATAFRERKPSTSDSDSSDDAMVLPLGLDSSDTDSDDSADKENEDGEKKKEKKPKENLRVKGEMSLRDLEPIVDLHISIPENKTEQIGVVMGIVDVLVTVESWPNKPALDLGTLLFLEGGQRTLGHIFEVFGQTRQPFYGVRFNSPEHISERGITIGAPVFAAPGTEHTRYVFLTQLERLKGTDASWKDDIETPNDQQDYSDDELERMQRNKGRKARARKQPVDRSLPPQEQAQEPTVDRAARKRNYNQHQNAAAPPNWYAAVGYQYGAMPPYTVPPGQPGGNAQPQQPYYPQGASPYYQFGAYPMDPATYAQYAQCYNWYNYDRATHPGNWYSANQAMFANTPGQWPPPQQPQSNSVPAVPATNVAESTKPKATV